GRTAGECLTSGLLNLSTRDRSRIRRRWIRDLRTRSIECSRPSTRCDVALILLGRTWNALLDLRVDRRVRSAMMRYRAAAAIRPVRVFIRAYISSRAAATISAAADGVEARTSATKSAWTARVN